MENCKSIHLDKQENIVLCMINESLSLKILKDVKQMNTTKAKAKTALASKEPQTIAYSPKRLPPESSKKLSELSPVEYFLKCFNTLDTETRKLKQFSPPHQSELFFKISHDFKAKIPQFSSAASTIMKQRILCAPLNMKSFEICQKFHDEIPSFIASFTKFQNQINPFYTNSLFDFLDAMKVNFNSFMIACSNDVQGRQIVSQYEASCYESMNEIEKLLQYVLAPAQFKHITVQAALDLAEKIKTLGRFFIHDLQQILTPYMNRSRQIMNFYTHFKVAFLSMVPMLTNIPNFLNQYQIVMKHVDPFKESFEKVYKCIGNTPDVVKLKGKPSVAGGHPEIPEIIIDPMDEPLNLMCDYLKLAETKEQSNLEKVLAINKKTKDMIESQQAEIARIAKRLEILEPLNSKEVILDRFQQIRKIKKEMQERELEERNKFMRSVVFQIKSLTANPTVNIHEDYYKQIRTTIVEISDNILTKEDRIKELENEINTTKQLLNSFDGDTLPEKINSLKTAVTQIQNKSRESDGKSIEVIKLAQTYSNTELPFDDSIKYLKDLIDKQSDEITQLKNENLKIEKNKAAFRKEATDVFNHVYEKLENLNGNMSPVVPTKLVEVRDNIKMLLEDLLVQKQKKQFDFYSFMTKLNSALQLTEIDYSKASEDDIEESMKTIVDSLTMPRKSDLFNTEPELARIKKKAEEQCKEIMCDICVRLSNQEKEHFSTFSIEELGKDIMNQIDNPSMSQFVEFMPEGESYDRTQYIKQSLLQIKNMKILFDAVNPQLDSMFSHAVLPSSYSFIKKAVEQMQDITKSTTENECVVNVLQYLRKSIQLFDLFTLSLQNVNISTSDQEIVRLNNELKTKVEEVSSLTEKNKECQTNFFEFLNAIKKETQSHEELLNRIHSQEIDAIIQFFSKIENDNDEF